MANLIKLGLNDAFTLAIIRSYNESFMLIQVDDFFSEVFRTTNGVRQGEVMSPKLFSIFLEDLINNMDAPGCGIKICN